jgi:dTDP-glucose 4,6-dehydratase
MKLLVTGGAGFIGSNFIHYYLNAYPEDEIVNLDALTYAGNLENLKDIQDNPRYTFVHGSITDKELVDELVGKVDAIVNFAAETHVDRSIMDSSPFIETNVRGTQVLLDAALKHGKKRFHHVSTDEVFGSLGPDDAPFTEETPYAPRNPYSASKAASDHLVRSYFHTHELPITISNCSNNYGPNCFPEKFIPLALANIKEGKKIPVYGDGQQIRDWIYVEDHARGIAAALHKGKPGETYLFGDDNEVKNLDLVKTMLKIRGASEDLIEFVKDRAGHDRRYATDSSKARNELGWKAEVSLEEGLQKTLDWFEQNQEWVDNCRSGAYRDYYNDQYVTR